MTSPPLIRVRPGDFVRAVGRVIAAAPEFHTRPERIDHVWIDIECSGWLRLAVNTCSRRNLEAGFEGRVRVGMVRSFWKELPALAMIPCRRLSYEAIELRHNVFYEFYDRAGLESLLLTKARSCMLVEAWGEYYSRNHQHGLHQIHSRRASCGVPEEIAGRDGALRFYFEREQTAEMLLFKFCGQ